MDIADYLKKYPNSTFSNSEVRAIVAELANLRERLEKAENIALRENAKLMANCQRAAFDLPTGYQVEIVIENMAGWVQLRNPDGDFIELHNSDLDLAEQVSEAIDAAIKAQKEGKS